MPSKALYRSAIAVIILAAIFSIPAGSFAAPPSILSYQGRLTNASGDLLGGSSGTTYYFRFSIWSDLTGGSQLWPASTPSIVGLTVQNGVFNGLIGDTSAGFDALSLDFDTDPSIYLRVEVSTSDTFATSETLAPRQRIVSSGFAINADTVDGSSAGTSANNVLKLGSSAEITVTGNITTSLDAAINGGDLTTTATTFNLANATATTLNIGGAATTLSLGASTGTTTVNNALTVTGALTANGTVDINSTTAITSGSFIANDLLLTINPAATSSANYYGNFNVADYQANFATTSGIFVIGGWDEGRNSGTNTLENVVGSWSRAANTSSGTINDAYGAVGQARNSAAGTLVRGYGVVGASRNDSTGVITDAVGVWGDIINANAAGVITNAYNLRATVPFSNAGTITNLYGVYIDAQSPTGGGTITNKWALYQAGANDRSYFAGNVNFNDDAELQLGTGTDARLLWETADTDAHYLNLAVTGASRNIIISEDLATDWTHATSTNPTLWIQSADAGTVAQYISLAHNQTDGVISVGAGAGIIDAPNGVQLHDGSVSALTATSDGTSATWTAAASDNIIIAPTTAGDLTINSAGADFGIIMQNRTITAGAANDAVSITPVWASENFIHQALAVTATQNGESSTSTVGVASGIIKATGATALSVGQAFRAVTPTITGTINNTYGLQVEDQGHATAVLNAYGINIASQTASSTLSRAIRIQGTGAANAIELGDSPLIYSSGAEVLRFDDSTAARGVAFTLTAAGNQTIGSSAGNLELAVAGTSETTLTSSALSPTTTDSNALGTSSLFWSDLFLASGGVINFNSDVTITHAANTLAFAGVTGSYTFDDEIDITQAAAGESLDINVTATTYTTALGAIDLVRSGALAGVDTESILDLNIKPTFTLTEPGISEIITYNLANIDTSSLAVTAGAGDSAVNALNIVISADSDIGIAKAINVELSDGTDVFWVSSVGKIESNMSGNNGPHLFDASFQNGAIGLMAWENSQKSGTQFLQEIQPNSGTTSNSTTLTLTNMRFSAATTMGTSSILNGIVLDLGSSVTGANGVTQTGIDLELVGGTYTGSGTESFTGINMDSDSAISQTTAGGTINWRGATITAPAATANFAGSTVSERGLDVVLSAITGTAGTITADGITVTIPVSGAIVTAGTMSGVNIVAPTTSGPAAGTLYGLQIGALTSAGGGTEQAVSIGAGWDTDINAATSLEIGIGGTNELYLDGDDFSPATTDSNALGTSSLFWSDLFLASGGVINFNSDVTLTHATDALTMAGGNLTVTQPVFTSGSPTGLTFTGGAHTTLAASTESSDVYYDLSRTVQFATGALAEQRAFRIDAPTYGFVAASALDSATTVDITGVPRAGANATISSAGALGVDGGTTDASETSTISIDFAAIADGVGTVTNLVGFRIWGDTLSLGNQTATLTDLRAVSVGQSTWTSTTNTRTVTNPVSLYIEGAPVNGANVLFTNAALALHVDTGTSAFGGNIVPDASDGSAIGTTALMWSDLFLASGSVINLNNGDVTLTHSADTLAFAGATSSYTFDDEVQITQAVAGESLDVNVTATTYTTALGAIDLVRSGALTGVDTETILDLNIKPTFTLTEPGTGGQTVTYNLASIDASSLAVTAGAGTSVINALNLVANADADAGTVRALNTNGNVLFTVDAAAENLSVTNSSIAYTDGDSFANFYRTGNLIGVAGEEIGDFEVQPGFTLTEPGSGSISYTAVNISLGEPGFLVTAGAGTSVVTALSVTASTDADIGTSRALDITGNSLFAGALAIAPTTTGTFLDFQLETEWTFGTLINADFASATTQSGGNMTGFALDLGTNVTGGNGLNQTGIDLELVGGTYIGTGTETFIGINMDSDSAISQTTAAGTISWKGVNITTPNITQTSGSITIYGEDITLGSVTTAGAQNGIRISNGSITTDGQQNLFVINPTGVGAGALRGIQIGAISSPGAGTETGISIGDGWDDAINVNAGKFIAETDGTVIATYATASGANGPFALCHETNGAATEAIKDCNGAPTADYAEQYPMASGISYGDIVVPGTREVITTAGHNIVELVRSSSSYQEPIVGIVSDNYSDFTSAGYNIDDQDNPMPVALVGRVPVNVVDENGPIAVGDFLTTSSTPGHAMRATRTGRVIGMALGTFDGERGQVMVQVLNTFWTGTDQLTASQDSNGSITVAEHNINMNGYAILEVGRIAGISGVWSISQDGSMQVRALTVGSPEGPAGITLHDEVSGSPSCVSLRNGEMVVRAGACGTVTVPSEASENSAPSPSGDEPLTQQPSPTEVEEDSGVNDVPVEAVPLTESAPVVSEPEVESESSLPSPSPLPEGEVSGGADNAPAPPEPVEETPVPIEASAEESEVNPAP